MTLDNLRGHCNEFHVNAEKEVVGFFKVYLAYKKELLKVKNSNE